jgi:hypothetical protein
VDVLLLDHDEKILVRYRMIRVRAYIKACFVGQSRRRSTAVGQRKSAQLVRDRETSIQTGTPTAALHVCCSGRGRSLVCNSSPIDNGGFDHTMVVPFDVVSCARCDRASCSLPLNQHSAASSNIPGRRKTGTSVAPVSVQAQQQQHHHRPMETRS